MSDITLVKPSIKKLIAVLDKQLFNFICGSDEEQDLFYQIDRLSDAENKKDKLICINDLDAYRAKGYSIQEGYWTINGLAHYIGHINK